MRNLNTSNSLVFVGVLALVLVLAPAQSYAEGSEVATFENGTWTPHVSFDEVRITINGPKGYHWQETFDYAGGLSVPNEALPDGSYTYELRFTAPGVGRAYTVETGETDVNGRTVERLDDGSEPARPAIASGGFFVKNGVVVRSSTEESNQ